MQTLGAGSATVPFPAQISRGFVQSPMFRIGSVAVCSCAGKAVVLASVAGHLLHDIGIPDASAYQAVESLMSGALANMKQTLPDDALTGPVVRGDAETVAKHLRALQGQSAASEVYRALSAAAVEIAERRGVDPKKLAAVSGLVRTAR